MAELLVLSPHLDDAVFSCWHLLDSAHDLLVVNVFTGLPERGIEPTRWDRITGADDSRARVEERLREDHEALALAGRSPIGLGFVEGQYGVALAVEELVARLETLAGARVVAPSGIGGHPEHVLVRDAALALGRPASFYADLPYATAFGWPSWTRGAEREAYVDPDADWESWIAPLRAHGYEPRVITLTDEQQRRKVEAMRTYRTQFAALEAGGQRRLTHPELLPLELTWEIPRPGYGYAARRG